MDPLLTVKEACNVLGVSKSWLDHRRSNGVADPAFVRVGNLVKYRRSDLNDFVERNLVKGAS